MPGAQVGALYRPAERNHEVGGDWYDVFPLPSGRLGICVGDIVGHELRAAVAMGQTHAALRLAAAADGGPRRVLESLDRLVPAVPDAFCATVGYAEFDPRRGLLTYACAGHLPPLLIEDGRANYLEDGRSAPLGVPEVERTQATQSVSSDAVLVWCSDGLVERRGSGIDAGLADLVPQAERLARDEPDPDAFCESLLAELTHGSSTEDDLVLVVVRLEPLGAPQLRRDRNSPASGSSSSDSDGAELVSVVPKL